MTMDFGYQHSKATSKRCNPIADGIFLNLLKNRDSIRVFWSELFKSELFKNSNDNETILAANKIANPIV